MKEIWMPVVGYQGLYEVSNKGRVRSLDRSVLHKGKNRNIKGKILSVRKHHRFNYTSAAVMLCRDAKSKDTLVSRLVATAFIGNPYNKPNVNHLDNDATNNVFTNLEWVTHRENMDYAKEQGRFRNKGFSLSTGIITKGFEKYIR